MKIIDISEPIDAKTACFPGDTSFSFSLKTSYAQNHCFNLTSFTMSPHVGTHTDAPSHVSEEFSKDNGAGYLPLAPFIGPCMVVDLSPYSKEVTIELFQKALKQRKILSRVLLRTSSFKTFEQDFAYLSIDLVSFLSKYSVKLIGIDTPSVDSADSKTLDAHHALIAHDIVWLENLNLSSVTDGNYFLSALPLKLMELEAAPVRAVLLPILPEGLPC